MATPDPQLLADLVRNGMPFSAATVLAQDLANNIAAGGGSAVVVQPGALVSNPTQVPNAAAVQTYVDTAVSGVTAGNTNPISTTYTTVIPLDKPQGRDLGSQTLVTNTVLSIGTTVLNGSCSLTLVGDGTHTLDFSVFYNGNNFTFNNATGAINEMVFLQRAASRPYIFGFNGPVIDTVAPTLVSATVAAATPNRISLVWSEAMDPDISAFGQFAVSAGHTITAHTYVDSTHTYLTVDNFVAGETARTLAYTVPATSKMRDLSQNLLVTFSGTAITNLAASLPTITGVQVASGTPGTIEVTLSEAYSGSLPSVSAFAVSAGHTLNAIGAGSAANKINLTTSTSFIFGEAARTLSYTKPGTNPITGTTSLQALASVSGVAITNNVAGAATLTKTTFTTPGGTYNLTTATSPAYADWYERGQNNSSAGTASVARKAGANLIVDNGVFGPCSFGSSTYGSLQNFSCNTTDSSGWGGTGAMFHDLSQAVVWTNTGVQGGWSYTFPTSTSQAYKVRIWAGTFSPGFVLNATMSTGAATTADYVCNSNGNNFVEYTFQGDVGGATVTISLQKASASTVLNANYDACIQMVTLQTT